MHWWHETASHAIERTAGFCDSFRPVTAMLEKCRVALNLTCVDPEGLVWQVLDAAWVNCLPVASENALPCYDRQGYRKILQFAKPKDEPYGRHLFAYTYSDFDQTLLQQTQL